jgi:hypothetical protein
MTKKKIKIVKKTPKKASIPKIQTKPTVSTRPVSNNFLGRAINRLIYLPDGEFSMTRIIMVLVVGQALLTGLAGLICGIFTSVKIPIEVYDFSIKLVGGGVLQYVGTKVKKSIDQNMENNKNIPKV